MKLVRPHQKLVLSLQTFACNNRKLQLYIKVVPLSCGPSILLYLTSTAMPTLGDHINHHMLASHSINRHCQCQGKRRAFVWKPSGVVLLLRLPTSVVLLLPLERPLHTTEDVVSDTSHVAKLYFKCFMYCRGMVQLCLRGCYQNR